MPKENKGANAVKTADAALADKRAAALWPAMQAASAYAGNAKAAANLQSHAQTQTQMQMRKADASAPAPQAQAQTRKAGASAQMPQMRGADASAPTPQARSAEIGAPTPHTADTRADAIAERLAEILEKEAQLYQDAANIAPKKTDIIVQGKIEELESIVAAEQAIILKIGRLEGERETAVNELSAELGRDLSSATLTEINALLGERSFQRLDACQKNLSQTLVSLRNKNDTNAQLLQNALDYVNFSVNLIASDEAGSLYSPDGADGALGAARKSIFDVKL